MWRRTLCILGIRWLCVMKTTEESFVRSLSFEMSLFPLLSFRPPSLPIAFIIIIADDDDGSTFISIASAAFVAVMSSPPSED